MESKCANPGTGDSGARQEEQHFGRSAVPAETNNPNAVPKQASRDPFKALPPRSDGDRAAVVTQTILQIVRQALSARSYGNPTSMREVRADIEATLRHEFQDAAQQAINEIRLTDE
jgi:hypothetical protein